MPRRKRTKVTPRPNTSAEAEFEKELEIFRTEAEAAGQFFYSWLGVHAAAHADKTVYQTLNSAPLFWMTNLGALQTSAFVTLGRIFDQNSAHNVGKLLRLAQDNPQVFSLAMLGKRKQGVAKTPPTWLSDYLRQAYVPKAEDFRRLRAHVKKRRKIYEQKYQPLRHRVFAHKGSSDQETVSKLFAKTNIREMQRLLVFLSSLHEALRELFLNGRRPVLRPRRYSVARMRGRPSAPAQSQAVHERVVHEAEGFLRNAAKAGSGDSSWP